MCARTRARRPAARVCLPAADSRRAGRAAGTRRTVESGSRVLDLGSKGLDAAGNRTPCCRAAKRRLTPRAAGPCPLAVCPGWWRRSRSRQGLECTRQAGGVALPALGAPCRLPRPQPQSFPAPAGLALCGGACVHGAGRSLEPGPGLGSAPPPLPAPCRQRAPRGPRAWGLGPGSGVRGPSVAERLSGAAGLGVGCGRSSAGSGACSLNPLSVLSISLFAWRKSFSANTSQVQCSVFVFLAHSWGLTLQLRGLYKSVCSTWGTFLQIYWRRRLKPRFGSHKPNFSPSPGCLFSCKQISTPCLEKEFMTIIEA